MKKILFTGMLIAALMPMVGCSDDDDNNGSKTGPESVTIVYELNIKLSEDYLKMNDFTLAYTDFNGTYCKVPMTANGLSVTITSKGVPATLDIDMPCVSKNPSDLTLSGSLGLEITQKIYAMVGDIYQEIPEHSFEYSSTIDGVTPENIQTVADTQFCHFEDVFGKYEFSISGTTVNCIFTTMEELSDGDAIDELSYFSNKLVTVASTGEVIRNYGAVLNEDNPNVISLSVADYAEAVDIFESWVPDVAKLATTSTSVTFNPTNAKGESQGTITLAKKDGSDGIIAAVSFSDGASVAYVEGINFYLTEAWPGNSDICYKRGDTITGYVPKIQYDTYADIWPADYFLPLEDEEQVTFYCYNDASDGQTAYFIYVHPRCVRFITTWPENCADALLNQVYTYLPTKEGLYDFFANVMNKNYSDLTSFWSEMTGESIPSMYAWVSDDFRTTESKDGYFSSKASTVDLTSGDYSIYNNFWPWRNFTFLSILTKTAE